MHRLLVDTSALGLESLAVTGATFKHFKVLRPEAGEKFELFDGKGNWRVYSVSDPRGGALVSCGEARYTPPCEVPITLFACVTKGSRWDWTIEKAVELGASRIVPVISDRTIVRIPRAERPAKRERWQRIAEDAARQSDAKWIPEISEAVDFRDSLSEVRESACFVGALTEPPPPPILEAIVHRGAPPPAGYSVYIGPEGDFTPEELAALIEAAVPVSFGPNVLRAETAAVFALSVLAAAVRK